MHNCVAVGLRLACFGIRRVGQQSIESSKMCLQLLCRSTPITIGKTQQKTSYGQTSTENLTITRKRLLESAYSARPYLPHVPRPRLRRMFDSWAGTHVAPGLYSHLCSAVFWAAASLLPLSAFYIPVRHFTCTFSCPPACFILC